MINDCKNDNFSEKCIEDLPIQDPRSYYDGESKREGSNAYWDLDAMEIIGGLVLMLPFIFFLFVFPLILLAITIIEIIS